MEDGECAIKSKPDPELKRVEVGALASEIELGKSIPVQGEWSKDGKGCNSLEDSPHELAVEEADHEPADEDRDEELHLGEVPIKVASNVCLTVHEHVEEDRANSHGHAVHAVPADGLAVVLVSDEASHLILSLGAIISGVDLSVTHLQFIYLNYIIYRPRILFN